MKTSVAATLGALCLAAGLAGQSLPTSAVCVDCHRGLRDERLAKPVTDFEGDVHAERGFDCLDCHGASTGRVQGSGFLGEPTRQQIPALCGRCHSDGAFMRQYNPSLRVDQVAEYATSVHGQRLARYNDPRVAVCTSCHPAHRIRPPSDRESGVHPLNISATCGSCHSDASRMRSYRIPTTQRAQYERSIHWKWMTEEEDLSAPTCNDCHGNHGAAPPGVSSVQNVCGQCHSVMMEFFVQSGHAEHFAARGLPGCGTCHGNHEIEPTSDELLFVVGDAVCVRCHDANEPALVGFGQIKTWVDSLDAERAQAQAVLLEAQNAGMEVSQPQFELEEATTALVKARTAVHTFTLDSVIQQVLAGIAVTAAAHGRGEEALEEHLFRRQGLAVSVGLIVLLILGLLLKIRHFERPRP